MLKSEMHTKLMVEENRRHFNIVRELQGCTEFEQNLKNENRRHEKATRYLYEQYLYAKNCERIRLEELKTEFDKLFTLKFMDCYSEKEITSEISQQDFNFLREMKALQLCGYCDGICYYTPVWR